MSTSFGEYAAPTDTISAILASYPFSIGILRELIQNSDDAKASKQIFLLDSRRHPIESLYDPKLKNTQGPALLAFNDALFSEDDWGALQSIHRSSKKTDTTKIGKYGIGFRSCYHVTDNPQILSGSSLAILDPHQNFTNAGGVKFDIFQRSDKYTDQLSSFDWFLPERGSSGQLSGSVIRLPLRTTAATSIINTKVVDPTEIHELFEEFVRKEIDISLLFLQNVSSIEVHEIDEHGNNTCLAKANITRDPVDLLDVDDELHRTHRSTVTVDTPLTHGPVEKTWRILQSSFPQSQATIHLLECDSISILSKHKLLPEVAIAMPLSILTEAEIGGRLFTYLPLPLRTGFPGHVHGLFALTQSRQNLRNGGEIGIARGSDDSVLVKWNNLLFEIFLPRTWTILLRILVNEDHLTDVFRAWPSSQPSVECGDSSYWQSLPSKLLADIAMSGSPVWPVIGCTNSKVVTQFVDFESVLVALPDTEGEILRAFGNADIKITQPPEYIMQLLLDSPDVTYTLLKPDNAHRILLDHISQLDGLGSSDRTLIVKFLLSTRNLVNIIGLPLVQLLDGQYVALTSHGSSPVIHTMLDRSDVSVFNLFDKSAIALDMLCPFLADLFRADGERILNLRPLTPERVVEYLSLDPNPLGQDLSHVRISDSVVEWLSLFWEWLGKWSAREMLYPSIRHFFLLPSRNGLKSLENGIFSEIGVNPALLDILQTLDIHFLHFQFSPSAQRTVNECDNLAMKSPCHIHDLLDHVQIGHHCRIDPDAAREIFGHIVCYLPESCRCHGPLDVTQRRKLRSLPIFPLLEPLATMTDGCNTLEVLACIPEGKVAKGVTNVTILPSIHDTLFLNGTLADLAVLPHLELDSRPLSELDILTLALNHFPEQPEHLQIGFVKYMDQNRIHLPPSVFQHLQKVRFVIVADETVQSPGNVVDPNSELAGLFTQSDHHLPCISRQVALVGDLSALQLFRSELTVDIVQERIQFISLNYSSAKDISGIAHNLLGLLYRSGFDCTQLDIPLEAKWLPTANGILGPQECRDRGSNTPELFDEVLPLVNRDISISSSLRTSLGWDEQIPIWILNKQLALLLESENPYKKLKALIKEFGQRLLTDEDIRNLRIVTSSRPWIPISSGRLAKTSHAIFSSTVGFPGFHQISPSLAEPTRNFLLRMGCTDRPSRVALLAEIKNLNQQSPCTEIANQTISILQGLPEDLTDKERADIFVPDNNLQPHPIACLLYNDVGDRHVLVHHDDFFLAHPKVDETLANKLRMERLGLKFLHLKNPGIDMGEQLTTRIRNVLMEYTEHQIFSEFLANAADAGASDFGILVDECPAPGTMLLSSALAPFQSCPSLIIYNNGTFTEKDFEGIRRIGTGGKEGKTSTIGQFGLGALSMYHFTEMAMIVSRDQVLFLDPSKTHLPIPDWASILLPLEQIKRCYSDHLAALDGLFDFQMTSPFYNGTLFRLPLRNISHTNSDSISKTPRTAHDVWDNIVQPYRKSAQQCLLFTELKTIKTFYRDSAVVNHKAGHSPLSPHSCNEDWKVASVTVPGAELPGEFRSLVEKHRLRSPIVVGLAARLNATDIIQAKAVHSLFSTLPLPIETTLPVHLTASFILASDRRNIRFDDYGSLESKYNQWLLSSILPPLYLFLLADILRHQGGNKDWWPGNTPHHDTITRTLVDEFYSTYLAITERPVFLSVYSSRSLLPGEAVLLGEPPSSVTKVLSVLRSPKLVELPSRVHQRCKANIRFVDPAFVKNEIIRETTKFLSIFSPDQSGLREMKSLISFMLGNGAEDLVGLPLLPLADGTLATIERVGNPKSYYVWKPLFANRPLFPSHHLVHPDFVADQLLKKDLNVTKLTDFAIRELVRERIPEGTELDGMTPADEAWISTFWTEYRDLEVADSHISSFPLVRTTKPAFYVSLDQCKLFTVIQTTSLEPEWLWGCLEKLGATIVNRRSRDIPSALRNILQVEADFPSFDFRRVLLFFETVKSSIARRFDCLDDPTHRKFADWAVTKVCSPPMHLFAARSLPIWSELHMNQAPRFRPASEITMLPSEVTRDVAVRFMGNPFVQYHSALVHLQVKPISFCQFRDQLKLPKILGRTDLPVYERLLDTILSNRQSDSRDVLVPNGNHVLVESSKLYSRDPLFVAAFGTSTERFILERFRHLETRLHSFGLKRQVHLDLDLFKACATAIHEDARNRIERAGTVFQVYGEDLPMHIRSNEQSSWRQLDSLRFIPRDIVRRRSMNVLEDSEYVKPLPNVVAPSEVLRAEFEAIAWTQRALFLIPPNERVLLVNRDLGQPSVGEVVLHLRTLALQVAKDNPSNEHVLSDLEATYKWLNTQGDAGNILIQHHDEPLFLNVDDPSHDVWTWRCADELFFNISDSNGLHPVYSVRKFLVPFRDLLLVCGVAEIVNPPCPTTLVSSADLQLTLLRSGFDSMRQTQKLTDVVFIALNGDEFPAHRSLLVPTSEYFLDLFCGEFDESGPASSENPVEVSVMHSSLCLKSTLDHIYVGCVPDVDTLALTELLDIIALALYWGITELSEAIQAKIISNMLINQCTFEKIRERAEELGAKLLTDVCRIFEQDNMDVIRRVRNGV